MSSDETTKTVATISYCGFQLPNVHLEPDFSEFKEQFKREFSLENILKEDDKINIYYKDEKDKKKIVEESSDYSDMLNSFSGSNKNKVVYVETDKIPVHFNGGESIEFEDEIKKVVERELRIAANNIKKCLTTNISLSNSKKVRSQCCEECKEQIIGYLYKKIDPDEGDKYYCEVCSSSVDEPLFKIN